MSLAIDTNKVRAVLLLDGEWYECAPMANGKSSFDLDSYEFLDGEHVILGGGACEGIPSTGATWQGGEGWRIAVPLTSLVAVKEVYEVEGEEEKP